jgi:molybdate transport system substrate-binding protein
MEGHWTCSLSIAAAVAFMFFSADIDYPKRLEAVGLAESGTMYRYGTGKLVLWVPNDSKLDLTRGLQVLLDPSIKKIAIANPDHAPYGRAAVAALRHENIYDRVSSKFVLGENISQTATFVVSGSAAIGIVALSLAVAPPMKTKGRYFEIPADDYPPIEQAAVIIKSSQHKDFARQYLDFLRIRPLQGLLRSYGFSVPDNPPDTH